MNSSVYLNLNRELRQTVLSAASKVRQHSITTDRIRHKNILRPEVLSADDELSTSSALPAVMLPEAEDNSDACRLAAASSVVDNDAGEMTSVLTTPQPIRSQHDEACYVDVVVPLVDTTYTYAMTSLECVKQCTETDDDAQL